MLFKNAKLRSLIYRLLPPTKKSELIGTINYFRFRKLWNPEKVRQFSQLHSGKTIFIVASGASLRETNLEALETHPVIFVNSSVKLASKICPPHSYWIVAGQRVNQYKEMSRVNLDASFRGLGAMGTRIMRRAIRSDDIVLRMPVRFGLLKVTDDSRCNFSHDLSKKICWGGGGSVVFLALQIAKYMGAKKVILVGFDIGVRDGQPSHFDENFQPAVYEDRRERTLDALRRYRKIFDDAGIELLNGSAWTRDTVLPRIEL